MGTAFASVSLIYTEGGSSVNLSQSIDGGQAYILTKKIHSGDPRYAWFVEAIYTHITGRTGQTNMQVLVSGTDEETNPIGGSIVGNAPISTLEPSFFKLDGFRFFEFGFYDFNVKERWRLHGFDVFGEIGDYGIGISEQPV